MADPWFKFYPTDWRSDPALRMCSLSARGLWIEMIGLMHESAQYGHLLVANRPLTDAHLAVLIGATPEQVSELIGELETAGVFSRTRKGVIYSRKMVRDAKKAETGRKFAKKRWSQTTECKEETALPNGSPIGTPTTQKPEARSQKPEREKEEPNGSSKKTGSRLREGWQLPKDWGDWAVDRGLPEDRVRLEAEKFGNYWQALPGSKGTKLDWQATWRNWIIKAVDDSRAAAPPTQPEHLETRRAERRKQWASF